jgi:hypothetical protein
MTIVQKNITRFNGIPAWIVLIMLIAASCGRDGNPAGTTAVLPVAVSSAIAITASLTGNQEVPPVVTAGSGVAVLSVNLATGALSGTVNFSGLSSVAVAAHIHEGAAGVNGLIIIPLAGGIGLTGGTWTVPAGTVMTAAQLAELQAGGLYVQIHTVMFPAGEIRGQLIIP